MAIKMSVATRNARLEAVESAIGASAVVKIRTGAVPGNIADADAGSVLATVALPADWMAAAAGGVKALASRGGTVVAATATPGAGEVLCVWGPDALTAGMWRVQVRAGAIEATARTVYHEDVRMDDTLRAVP